MFESKKNNNLLNSFNVVFFLGMILVNAFIVYYSMDENILKKIYDGFSSKLIPIEQTFYIWGLIYILLGVFIIGQFFNMSDFITESNKSSKVGIFFVLSCIGNVGFVISSYFGEVMFSLLSIAVVFLSLLFIYIRVNNRDEKYNSKEKIVVKYPFSIYFAWVTFSTLISISTFLEDKGWENAFISESVFFYIAIAVLLITGIISILVYFDMAFVFTYIWALLGILYKSLNDKKYGIEDMGLIIGIIVLFIVISIIKKSKVNRENVLF